MVTGARCPLSQPLFGGGTGLGLAVTGRTHQPPAHCPHCKAHRAAPGDIMRRVVGEGKRRLPNPALLVCPQVPLSAINTCPQEEL